LPELPEVETYTRYFATHALNQRIARVDVRDERILGEIRKETFVRRLRGREFSEARRHGKHLFVRVSSRAESRDPGSRVARSSRRHSARSLYSARDDAGWLHLHFGMTGDLAYYRGRDEEPRFAKVIFDFDNGAHLAFEDMRLFGLVDLIDSPERITSRLGVDPLDPSLTFRRFAGILEKRKGAIKSLLMTQEVIAGLGNLYADEILFTTAIHPRRPVHELKDDEKRAIFTAMRKILRENIARQGRGADWPARYLTNHREEGTRCPKCGGTIERTVVFGRTTYFCAKHQR
jgi:formamidopyrimidine-DNA glycosylase